MEEIVGQWWHRAITRVADRNHRDAAVALESMKRPIGMLFRVGGGPASVRIAPASQSASGGPRGWLQRIAGSGLRAATTRLEPEVLALPPELAVFDEAALNRDLYLWLAALAAQFDDRGRWLADNVAATERTLSAFAGLRGMHARLLQAHLAQRPCPDALSRDAAAAEAALQAALRGERHDGPALSPRDVAPVWLWLEGAAARPAPAPRAEPDAAGHCAGAPGATDRKRRRAESSVDDRSKAPLMMFFRAESILSWSEHVKVDRASDDSDDGQALAAADDMNVLSIAPDGRSTASRVRFDLDLPSASADDLPLGPGLKLPEWDYRRGLLQPEHCAVQCHVARPGPAFVPQPALRATARRVRRRLEALRAAPRWVRAQEQGDAIDLDAWVRHATEARRGPHSEAPPVYARRSDDERSLATLLLADLSLSTDAFVPGLDGAPEQRVIDIIRDALYVFGEALAGSGDAFEMLGFSSVRRQHVRLQHLKGFGERWGDAARQRVGAIRPGYYTRMGAALRFATRRLAERAERQRLLLILTDGKPNDLDVYEGRYGLEDTRHAVDEARAAGLKPFCVTIDERAHDYLPLLFGQGGYALVHRPQQLVGRLAQVYAGLTR